MCYILCTRNPKSLSLWIKYLKLFNRWSFAASFADTSTLARTLWRTTSEASTTPDTRSRTSTLSLKWFRPRRPRPTSLGTRLRGPPILQELRLQSHPTSSSRRPSLRRWRASQTRWWGAVTRRKRRRKIFRRKCVRRLAHSRGHILASEIWSSPVYVKLFKLCFLKILSRSNSLFLRLV